MTGQASQKAEKISNLAVAGLTRQQTADEVGVSYGYVVKLASQNGIAFARQPRCNVQRGPDIRSHQMAALYKSGRTLEEIGSQFSLTRERVRQIITKYHGLRAESGGQKVRAEAKRQKFEAKRNVRCLKKWGCSWDQYVELRSMIKPTRAFACQKRNAAERGIEWILSLWQWWSIWQQSGHWSDRGRGRGYQMCRKGDQGPYSVNNVYIATGTENIQDYWADVKSGARERHCLGRNAIVSPEHARAVAKAAADRYRKTPKFKLRYQLRRQGLPKEQRDAIVAERFGVSP